MPSRPSAHSLAHPPITQPPAHRLTVSPTHTSLRTSPPGSPIAHQTPTVPHQPHASPSSHPSISAHPSRLAPYLSFFFMVEIHSPNIMSYPRPFPGARAALEKPDSDG